MLSAGLAAIAALWLVAPKAHADDEPGLVEGWRWVARVPAVEFDGETRFREARIRLWVEMGWLIVRRTAGEDDFEWQVVLARATDPKKPTINIDEESGNVDIGYRGYFVRESPAGKFRILREIKTADSPPWPKCDRQGPPDRGTGIFTAWLEDDWRFLRVGPSFARPTRADPAKDFELSDVWFRFQPRSWPVRLIPKGQQRPATGVHMTGGVPGAPVEAYAASEPSRLRFDVVSLEDDLIVGSRVMLDQAARGVSGNTLRDCLLTSDAPPLEVKSWVNVREPLSLEKLAGHVVLVDFWSARCARSAAQLAQIEALQKKYGNRGFVPVGIHPAAGSDDVPELLKRRGVTFPIGIDAAGENRSFTGESAARYCAQGDPAYFLIDRSGKLMLAFGMEPPTEAEIERLLLQDGLPPPLAGGEWFNAPQPLNLGDLKGKPVLLTFLDVRHPSTRRQIEEIRAIVDRFGPRGLTVIGVSRYEAESLIKANGITYPVLSDKGETAHEYYLRTFARGSFLIGRDGKLRGGSRQSVSPEDVEKLLE